MQRTLIGLIFLFLVVPATSYANCRPGATQQLPAVIDLNCVARYGTRCHNDAQWNPEPGWVVRSHRIRVVSSSHGEHSVSIVAGGSRFISRRELDDALNSALEVVVTIPGETGQAQRYEAAIRDSYNQRVRMLTDVSASHNTIAARVQAYGPGNVFDQRRGWHHINVDATVVCVGAPGNSRAIADEFVQAAYAAHGRPQPVVQPRPLQPTVQSQPKFQDFSINAAIVVQPCTSTTVSVSDIVRSSCSAEGFCALSTVSSDLSAEIYSAYKKDNPWREMNMICPRQLHIDYSCRGSPR